MRRAIVHIGTPRTGTTSLQAVLSAHRRDLEQVGILYPELTPRAVAALPHVSHQYFGETLDGRRSRHERAELLTLLDESLARAGSDVVILSYEGLCLLPFWRHAPAILADLFARRGYRMEVMLTVKAQALYAQSQYTWRCQFLRERRFFADALPRDLRSRRYDYNAMLRGWSRGPDRPVHVVPVHDHRSDAPLIERIFTQLDLADRVFPFLNGAETMRRDNPSLGPVAIEVARRLRDRGMVCKDRTRARAITDFVTAEVQASGLDGVSFQGLDEATARRVETDFAAGNERFAQQVWGESWLRRVAPASPAQINALGANVADRDLARLVEELAATATARFGLSAGTGFGAFLRGFGRG